MEIKALVPMAEVASVARSIEFYGRLGFEVLGTFTPPDAQAASWASLRNGAAAELMVTAGGGDAAGSRPVLFYLYCDDVAAARAALEAAGVECGPVRYPFYAPRGEFEVRDPDGYRLMITHT